jgi:hypothetical protein
LIKELENNGGLLALTTILNVDVTVLNPSDNIAAILYVLIYPTELGAMLYDPPE